MLIGSERIDLGLTLIDSAQCFRWTREGDSFGAVVDEKCNLAYGNAGRRER